MAFTDDAEQYARDRMRRRERDLERLWAEVCRLHDPTMLHRLHNVVYPDMRHFMCPASWTDEGWARHGGKDRLPGAIQDAIEEALNGSLH